MFLSTKTLWSDKCPLYRAFAGDDLGISYLQLIQLIYCLDLEQYYKEVVTSNRHFYLCLAHQCNPIQFSSLVSFLLQLPVLPSRIYETVIEAIVNHHEDHVKVLEKILDHFIVRYTKSNG